MGWGSHNLKRVGPDCAPFSQFDKVLDLCCLPKHVKYCSSTNQQFLFFQISHANKLRFSKNYEWYKVTTELQANAFPRLVASFRYLQFVHYTGYHIP